MDLRKMTWKKVSAFATRRAKRVIQGYSKDSSSKLGGCEEPMSIASIIKYTADRIGILSCCGEIVQRFARCSRKPECLGTFRTECAFSVGAVASLYPMRERRWMESEPIN